MNNKEIRDYPLDKINKMRIRDERRNRVLKVIFSVIAIILTFCIGFVSGFYMNMPQNEKVTSVSGDAEATSGGEKKIMSEVEEKKDLIPETEKLEELKQSFIDKVHQKYPSVTLSFGIKNLNTGAAIIHNDIQMNSASVIKLFIMETIYDEASKGSYILTEDAKKDLELMITESNNKAANRFIDDFGGENELRKITEENLINKTILSGGYTNTQINRKMHDTTPPGGPTGYENYTSARDSIMLLEKIYKKTLFNEPYNTEALNLLKAQQRRAKIPSKITEKYLDVIVANKTGELSQVENDVALIMSDKFNIAFAVFINDIPKKNDGTTDYKLKEEVQATISELGSELVEFYKNNSF